MSRSRRKASRGGDRPRRLGPVAITVSAFALVLSLGWWGWSVSEQAREGWWALGEHVAITPDEAGWAEVDTLGVRLTGVQTLSVVEEEEPPAGLTYLALDFEVRAEEELPWSSCQVEVEDESGRLFEASIEVPYADSYVSRLTCGSADPAEEPVPGRQSLLVLVPEDVEPVAVRVHATEFPPARFIELPVADVE